MFSQHFTPFFLLIVGYTLVCSYWLWVTVATRDHCICPPCNLYTSYVYIKLQKYKDMAKPILM